MLQGNRWNKVIIGDAIKIKDQRKIKHVVILTNWFYKTIIIAFVHITINIVSVIVLILQDIYA